MCFGLGNLSNIPLGLIFVFKWGSSFVSHGKERRRDGRRKNQSWNAENCAENGLGQDGHSWRHVNSTTLNQ